MRRSTFLAAGLAAAAMLAAVPAADAATVGCRSADMRYRYAPDLPKNFGVFRLTATNTGCATARKVAKAFMTFAETKGGAPKRAAGFAISTTIPESQTWAVRARKGTALVRFRYVVANG